MRDGHHGGFFLQIQFARTVAETQSCRMRILLNGPEWNPWQVNFIIAIEIPMLLPSQVGIIGLDHGHVQQERTFGILSSMIEQESFLSLIHI